MLQLLFGSLLVVAVLFGSDYLSRKKLVSGELSRKSTHITMSVVFAALPFFIDLRTIALIAFADIFLAILARKFNLFSRLRSVDRRSWGDLFFLLGVIGAALLADSNWIFATGILIMGLADAAAALVGKSKGRLDYKVFGHNKTLEGSLAFFVTGILILVWMILFMPSRLNATISNLLLLPLATMAIEAVMPLGLDNLVLPIFIVIVLNVIG